MEKSLTVRKALLALQQKVYRKYFLSAFNCGVHCSPKSLNLIPTFHVSLFIACLQQKAVQLIDKTISYPSAIIAYTRVQYAWNDW